MCDFCLLLRVLVAVIAKMMIVNMSFVTAKGMKIEQGRKVIYAKS